MCVMRRVRSILTARENPEDMHTRVNQGKWWQAYIDDCGPEEPSYFSETMARTIPIVPSRTRLLDLGCGSGIIGSFCLIEKQARFVTFTDLMPEWIARARSNVGNQIARGRIAPSQAAFTEPMPFENLSPELVSQHDLICFNPPQLPTDYVAKEALEEIRTNAIEHTYRIGDIAENPDGLHVVQKFVAWHDRLPHPSPAAVILLSSFLGSHRIEETLNSGGSDWKIICATRTPLRDFFGSHVAQMGDTERRYRRLEQTPSGWSKELFTVQIAGK